MNCIMGAWQPGDPAPARDHPDYQAYIDYGYSQDPVASSVTWQDVYPEGVPDEAMEIYATRPVSRQHIQQVHEQIVLPALEREAEAKQGQVAKFAIPVAIAAIAFSMFQG